MKSPKSTKPSRGRPAFAPTAEQRKHVRLHVAFGTPQHAIAEVLGITEPTLRKHFSAEISVGLHEANATVAHSVYQQALGIPAQFDKEGQKLRAEVPRDIRAAIFWLKCRAGWRDSEAQPAKPSKRLAPPPPPKEEKLGKKQQQQLAAQRVGGKFAPPAPPKLIVKND